MKYIKRVATTFLNKIQGAVINSFNASVDETANAPSIKVVKEHSVVVSPTEPTTNEKVWIQTGKNLFNPNTMIEMTNSYRRFGDGVITTQSGYNGIKIPVKPSTTYIFSINEDYSNITFYDNNFNYINGTFKDGALFTTPENCFYITAAVHQNATIIQLEQGSIATEYEPYIEKAIYVRNNNGVYEKFINKEEINKMHYSTEEQVIGTWIDGKPIYRKVINVGQLPNATGKIIAHGLNNFRIINLRGCAYSSTGLMIFPYIARPDVNFLQFSTTVDITLTDIEIYTGSDRSDFTGYVILEYIKTTD